MKIAFLEMALAAAFIGVEVFVMAFGVIWLVLSGLLNLDAWIWPSIALGGALGAWAGMAALRQAGRTADFEASLSSNGDTASDASE